MAPPRHQKQLSNQFQHIASQRARVELNMCVLRMDVYVRTDNNLIRRLHNFPSIFLLHKFFQLDFPKSKTKIENEGTSNTILGINVSVRMYVCVSSTRQNIAVIHHSLSPCIGLFHFPACKCACVFSILHHRLTMAKHLSIEM